MMLKKLSIANEFILFAIFMSGLMLLMMGITTLALKFRWFQCIYIRGSNYALN